MTITLFIILLLKEIKGCDWAIDDVGVSYEYSVCSVVAVAFTVMHFIFLSTKV